MTTEHLSPDHNHTTEVFQRVSHKANFKPNVINRNKPSLYAVVILVVVLLFYAAAVLILYTPATKQELLIAKAASKACPVNHVAVWIDPTTIQCLKDITN